MNSFCYSHSDDGQTLTQHVLHNVVGVRYPVTADPFWSTAARIAKCTAAVGWLVASTALGWKAIQALGGVAMAARLLVAAGGVTDWMKAVAGAAACIGGSTNS